MKIVRENSLIEVTTSDLARICGGAMPPDSTSDVPATSPDPFFVAPTGEAGTLNGTGILVPPDLYPVDPAPTPDEEA